jgi:hypothetical protein
VGFVTVHGSLCGKLWSERGESRRRSFKLGTVRLMAFRQVMFLELVSGGRITVVELMSDLLPLRRSGSLMLAIFPRN